MPGTSYYGELFEHFIIVECLRLSSYYQNEYQFSYLCTKDGAEIDLVVDRPGQPKLFVEIKSANNVLPSQLANLKKLSDDYKNCEAICLSCDPHPKKYDLITVWPWKEGLKYIFKLPGSDFPVH